MSASGGESTLLIPPQGKFSTQIYGWTPDGNLLYVVSRRDGAQCIWAQRLDAATKRPRGEAFAVYHIHGARLKVTSSGLANFGPAILPDGIIFGLDEETGNVWIGDRK